MHKTLMLRACLVVALCAACTRVSTQTGMSGERHPWTQPGVLRIALPQDVKTLNPLLDSTTNDVFVDRLMFEPLVSADPSGNPVPMLAAAVPTRSNGGISSDGLTITYRLRRAAHWTDGAPVTSADVKWSWQAIMNDANDIISRHGYDDIARIDTPNPFTLVVHLKAPFAPFVNTFFAESDQPYDVVPAHVLSKYHDINQIPFDAAPTVSDGPFRFVEWVHGDHILLAANDSFFLGAPKLRRIRIEVIPNEQTSVELFRTHAIDYMYQATINTYQELRAISGVRIVFNDVNGYEGIGMNLSHSPLQDVRVRDAVASAIDKQSLVADLTYGQEKTATEDLPDWMWAFNPHAIPPPYDPARARALLALAGFVIGRDGVARRNGVPLHLVFASDAETATHRKEIQLVQAMLRKVGIDTEIKLYPLDVLYAAAGMGGILHSGRFDLITLPWFSGIDPDDSSQFMCKNMPPGGYNDTRYCNREMDAAQNEALTFYDRPARKRAYAKIEALLARDNPIVFLWWGRTQEPISIDFKGFAPNPTVESWNAWQWSI
jgi:peptide/nickel transport system substrate-binding protein